MTSLLNFSGLASGIDTGAIVSALVQAEAAPIRRMESTKTQLKSKSDKLEAISELLKTVKEAAEALRGSDEVLGIKASSDAEDALAITAKGSAATGTFDVTVTQEALAQRTYSDGVTDRYATDLLGTGTLKIKVGGDTEIDVLVSANTTLHSLANDINASGADVTAGIMYDGTNYRLMVTGNRTGATDGKVTFTESGTTIGLDDPLNVYRQSESATFSVDGFTRTSESNVIDDAIPGVSLTLKGQTTGAKVTLERDNVALGERLTTFVDAYNAAMTKIDSEFTRRGTNKLEESLFGDSALRSLKQKLSNTLLEEVSGLSGDYTYAATIGLSVDRRGKLSYDKDALEEAMQDNPSAVADLLRGNEASGVRGVMAMFADTIEAFTDPLDGLIPTRIDGIDDRMRGLDRQITQTQARLDKYESQMTAEFSMMEQLLSSLQTQGNQLNAMLSRL